MQKILVLNAGSTSVKFKLFNIDSSQHEVIAEGYVERIGLKGSRIVINTASGTPLSYEEPIENHKTAIKAILDYLAKKHIKNAAELSAVAHRLGYGGRYGSCVEIDNEVMQTLHDSIPLIPIHAPAMIKGINAAKDLLPNVMQTAVFDTAFHHSIKKEAYTCALPKDCCQSLGIRNYGFHGPSHRYVTELAAEFLGKKGRFISCHLGGGASVTAVKDGKSVMTSMGYTPVSGIIMATRSGNMDPYIPLHIMKTQNKTADEVNTMLNKECGLYALSRGHSDMRDIINEAEHGNQDCAFALKAYVYHLLKAVGECVAVMGGVDALIFTAGIGEKSAYIRKKLCEKLAYLGLELDDTANNAYPAPNIISTPKSALKVLVIPTNEELMMAKETYELFTELQQEKAV